MASTIHGLIHPRFKILVHGGAWDIPATLQEAHREGVLQAWNLAARLLEGDHDPLDVVAQVLSLLENDPTFDAGVGSFLNEDGNVELDASIMRGSDLAAGAIAAIQNFANPSQIALSLLREGQAVMLAGTGAEKFALLKGFKASKPQELVHSREIEAHKAWISAGRPNPKIYFAAQNINCGSEPHRRGTVGCVIGVPRGDRFFHLFSGTSTGGVPGKKLGRVGDVPVIGAGIIADDEGVALSATGWGEGLLRIGAASMVNERFKSGTPLKIALSETLTYLHRKLDGRGGLIAIDCLGHMEAAYSTPDMAFGGPSSTQLIF